MAGELNNLVSEFTRRRALSMPAAGEDGALSLTFDLHLEVRLFQVGDQVYLEGTLGELPESEDNAEILLARCLRQQLGRVRDQREVVSIDQDAGALVLHRRVAARDIDDRRFEALLSDFINSLEFWQLIATSSVGESAPRPVMPAMMTMVRP